MTEAVLIEIAQRFRALEDAIENPALHLETGDPDGDEARKELDMALERCCEDMTAMQEHIRRTFDSAFPRAVKSIP